MNLAIIIVLCLLIIILAVYWLMKEDTTVPPDTSTLLGLLINHQNWKFYGPGDIVIPYTFEIINDVGAGGKMRIVFYDEYGPHRGITTLLANYKRIDDYNFAIGDFQIESGIRKVPPVETWKLQKNGDWLTLDNGIVMTLKPV